MVPHQRTSGYRSGSMSASAMMRSNAIEARHSVEAHPLSAIWTPLRSVSMGRAYQSEIGQSLVRNLWLRAPPVTSLGYAPPRRRPAQRNDVRRGCRRSPCSAKAPSNALQLRLRSRDPGRRRRPLQTFLPRLPIAYGRYWPGAAVAKCHLWLGLACDRLNGL
jgi:hypothetical protein